MARTPHLPAPAETVKGSFFKQGAGGKGFNQGVAAHKAGGDVAMITKLGRDSMANVALDVMTELNMPKDFLFYNGDVATGIALIMVDENSSQNEIVIVPGACGTITAEDIKSVEQRICDSAYILLHRRASEKKVYNAPVLCYTTCRVVRRRVVCLTVFPPRGGASPVEHESRHRSGRCSVFSRVRLLVSFSVASAWR